MWFSLTLMRKRFHRPGVPSEFRAMLRETQGLHKQLEDTRVALERWQARAAQVADLMDPQGSGTTDEL